MKFRRLSSSYVLEINPQIMIGALARDNVDVINGKTDLYDSIINVPYEEFDDVEFKAERNNFILIRLKHSANRNHVEILNEIEKIVIDYAKGE